MAFLTWLQPPGRVGTSGVPKEAPHEAPRQHAGARGALGCREQGWAAPLCPQPRGCPHAGQPLAGLRAVPAGERSLWVHWEAPRAPVAAYVLEWQRVASEPGRCSACWQMERDGAATSALIQGKQGVLGGFWGVPASSAGFCAPGSLLCPWLGFPAANPAPSPRHTLPPCSPSAPRGLAQPGGLSSQDPQPAAPLCSLLQVASSPSSATTSPCAPSTRTPSGHPPTQQPTPGRRVRVLPAPPLGAHLGSPCAPNLGAVQKISAHRAGIWLAVAAQSPPGHRGSSSAPCSATCPAPFQHHPTPRSCT